MTWFISKPISAEDSDTPQVSPWFLWSPFVAMVVLTFAATPDDPLITLRYASNIWAGEGAVFNVGERVEGFSSPSHLGLDVLMWLLPGGADLLKAKLMSLLFGALALHEASRLIALTEWSYRFRLFATVATSSSWLLAVSSANALETTLALWLVVVIVRRLVGGFELRYAEITTAVAASLLLLTRPEAALMVGALAGVSLLVGGGTQFWVRIRWALMPVAAMIAYTTIRLWYFGYLFPNTYYAKSVPLDEALPRGLNYLVYGAWYPQRQRIIEPGWVLNLPDERLLLMALILGAALISLTAAGAISSPWWLRRRGLYIAAPVAAQVLFILNSGGDWMLGGRFLVPVLPLVVILQVRTIALLRRVHVGLAAAACVAILLPIPLQLRGGLYPAWSPASGSDRSLIMAGGYERHSEKWAVGADMLDCVPPGSVVAYSEMGFAPFVRRDLNFVDLAGLVNENIAHAIHKGLGPGDWSLSTSAAGREILRSGAEYVLMPVEGQERSILNNQFQAVDERQVPFHTMRLYQRSGGACD